MNALMTKPDPAKFQTVSERIARAPAHDAAHRDYDTVRLAIGFISEHWREQPAIEDMAAAVSVTPD